MTGLSQAEARRRLDLYGRNELPEAKRSFWPILRRQLSDVLVWLLLGACALSVGIAVFEAEGPLAVTDFVDALVIGAILVMNAVLGVVQEYRAENAIAALERLSGGHAVVWREGHQHEVPVAEVVPGDWIVLEAGDRVAADARLVEAAELEADESMLTGESEPVAKSLGDTVYGSTLVTGGSATAEVFATGPNSETGRIAQLMAEAETPPTPLQLQLGRLTWFLGAAALVVCAVVVLLGWMRHMPALEMLLIGVSLAVSAVPEGLPAVVTVCFAVGMQRMARQQALVRRLDALETLGAVTVIATDKTGTLTANRMTVVEHWVHQPEDRDLLAQIGLSCNRSEGGVGDPTEIALVHFGEAAGVERLPIDDLVVPFRSENRHMCTRHGERLFWKGAPERLFDLHGDDEAEEIFLEAAAEMGRAGRRVLAAAEGPLEDLRLVGLFGLEDPPREGVANAIRQAKRAGIRTVMVTGDHLDTAQAIARRVGIDGDALEGRAIDGLSEAELAETLKTVSVFGRVSPRHKVAICRALQGPGAVVAMTGDGVNDAPALRTAHVGIAMGLRGTEVAREAAAIVLADDHYATIVRAVREGRRIHDNIRRFVLFLLRGNTDELTLITLSLLVGLPIPFLPVHILWLNLLTDGLPALALSVEPAEPDVMDRPPRAPQQHLLHGEWGRLAAATLLGFTGTFGLYLWLTNTGTPLPIARSATLTLAVCIELGLAYSSRTRGFAWRVPLFGNPWLLGALATVFSAHLLLLYTPVGPALFRVHPFPGHVWAVIFAITVTVMGLFELTKQGGREAA